MSRDIQIGDKIGPIAYETDLNFEVIDKYEGGMGVVYVGLLKKYKTITALKTFKDGYYENAIDQFKEEALAWINLEIHPNIVNAILFDVINDRPFIFIEYIAPYKHRNTLEHYLSENLSNTQILDWGIQFCYGMEHAFSHHVSPHRDIKPANIMITRDKLLKITDFGLAKIWDNQKLDIKEYSSKHELTLFKNDKGAVMSGTYEWMAPETFSGQADIRSDIYSFGIVLYQMINNGEHPFNARTPEEWNKVHQDEEIAHIDSIIFPIVKKCLAKKPGNRYNDFVDLRKDLEELCVEVTGNTPYKPVNTIQRTKGIHLSKGYGYEKLGMVDDAIRTYDEAEKMDSTSFLDMVNLGAAYNRLQQPKKAVDQYRQAVKEKPENFLVHYNLANAYSYDLQFEEANDEYEESIRLNPNCKECHTNYGNLLRNLGDIDAAIEHYNIVLDLDSDFFLAKLNLGIALGQKEKFDEAINVFRGAEKINSKSVNLYIQWGILLSTMGDFEGAIFKYIKALSLDPENSELHVLMGILLFYKRNYENAVHEFREAIRVDPQNYIAFRNLARSLQQSGKIDEALECYDESLRINADQEVAWNQKGVTFAHLKRFDEALKCFDESLKIEPKYAVAWVNKGCVFGDLKQYEEALKCLNHALEIDHRCDKAWYHKGMTFLKLYSSTDGLIEALTCFDEAIKIKPIFHDAYFFKSMIWGMLGNTEEALKCINKALDINPDNVKYLHFKGSVLHSQNRDIEALECIEKARKIDPDWTLGA